MSAAAYIVEVETKETVEILRVDFQFPESDGPERTLKSIARCRVECRILAVYYAGPAEPGQRKGTTEHAKNQDLIPDV